MCGSRQTRAYGAIVASDAGTTQAGMVMVLAYESAPGDLQGGRGHGAAALRRPAGIRGGGGYWVAPNSRVRRLARCEHIKKVDTARMAYTISMHIPWGPSASPPKLQSTLWSLSRTELLPSMSEWTPPLGRSCRHTSPRCYDTHMWSRQWRSSTGPQASGPIQPARVAAGAGGRPRSGAI